MKFVGPRSGMKAYISALLIALFLGLVIWPSWSKPNDWVALETEFSVPIFLFFFLLSANYYLATSDIEIDDNRIAWNFLGYQWKEIAWRDVARVRILSTWDFRNSRWMKMVSVDQQNPSRMYFRKRGAIFFSEKISSFDELVRLIQLQSGKLDIPIINEEHK